MNTISCQDEAIALRNELQDINDAIADLTRRRADVCFRINRVCAVTSVCAPEILAAIFQHVCAFPCEFNVRDPHYPIILASVSRQWRQIVHSTPSLWTSLGIFFWDSEYASANALTILRTYFEKSASLTVSLRLSLPRAERGEQDALSDEEISQPPPSPSPPRRTSPRRPGLYDVRTQDMFKFIAFEHPAKLRALFVDDIPPSWLIVYIWGSPYDGLYSFQAPNLERIHIGMLEVRPVDWPSSRNIPSSTVPRLQHLSFGQRMPLGLEFPYQHLTTLELNDIPINDCLCVIHGCTVVVRCYCRRPRPPLENCPDPPIRPVTLHRVKTFGWTFCFQKWDEAFLQYVTLPALEVFRCEDQGPYDVIGLEFNQYTEQRWRNLQSTFLHQSPKLCVFECLAMDPLHWETLVLASDLPQTIEELHLRYVNATVANDFMRTLTPKPGSTHEPVPFPRLKYLSIEIEIIYWIQDLVLDLVRARRSEDLQGVGLRACLERLDLRRGRMGRTGGQMNIAKNLSDQFQKFVDDGLYLVTTVRDAGHMKWSRTPINASSV